jgi:hypothetical protein
MSNKAPFSSDEQQNAVFIKWATKRRFHQMSNKTPISSNEQQNADFIKWAIKRRFYQISNKTPISSNEQQNADLIKWATKRRFHQMLMHMLWIFKTLEMQVDEQVICRCYRRKLTRCYINCLLINPNKLDMFRATIFPVFRSIRLCNTAYDMPYPIRCRLVIWWWRNWLSRQITDRQRIGYNISQAVLHSLMLLKMDKIVARNMSS